MLMNRSSYIVSIGSALTLLFGASAAEANAKHHSTKSTAHTTISDHGPCVKGHILDLSRGAAQAAYGGQEKRPPYPCHR